jgi:hypothetical protein
MAERDPGDPPVGTPEDWADMAAMDKAAQNDPEGFDQYLSDFDKGNQERAEEGQGEA